MFVHSLNGLPKNDLKQVPESGYRNLNSAFYSELIIMRFQLYFLSLGPTYSSAKKRAEIDGLLRRTVLSFLHECSRLKVRSVALPALSRDVFGFPLKSCAKITAETIWSFLTDSKSSDIALRIIRVILNEPKRTADFSDVFSKVWKKLEE